MSSPIGIYENRKPELDIIFDANATENTLLDANDDPVTETGTAVVTWKNQNQGGRVADVIKTGESPIGFQLIYITNPTGTILRALRPTNTETLSLCSMIPRMSSIRSQTWFHTLVYRRFYGPTRKYTWNSICTVGLWRFGQRIDWGNCFAHSRSYAIMSPTFGMNTSIAMVQWQMTVNDNIIQLWYRLIQSTGTVENVWIPITDHQVTIRSDINRSAKNEVKVGSDDGGPFADIFELRIENIAQGSTEETLLTETLKAKYALP